MTSFYDIVQQFANFQEKSRLNQIKSVADIPLKPRRETLSPFAFSCSCTKIVVQILSSFLSLPFALSFQTHSPLQGPRQTQHLHFVILPSSALPLPTLQHRVNRFRLHVVELPGQDVHHYKYSAIPRTFFHPLTISSGYTTL